MKLAIKYQDPKALKPSPNNTREHSPEQVKQIVEAIGQFGFTNPILVDENNAIIAGHGRAMAALQVGLPTVPTIALSGLTETQKRAYMIADNKIALNATWNHDMLAMEIAELQDLDFDMSLIGFTDEELNKITEGLGVPDESEDGVYASEGKDQHKQAQTMVVVGEYRAVLDRDRYKAWLEEIRQSAGFKDEQVKAEMLRRLGL